jgi:hypothetical protein
MIGHPRGHRCASAAINTTQRKIKNIAPTTVNGSICVRVFTKRKNINSGGKIVNVLNAAASCLTVIIMYNAKNAVIF